MPYPALFNPGRIGTLDIRNRICMPAIHLGLCEDGAPTPALLDFYEERSRGGAGMITVGVCNSWSGRPARLKGALDLSDDRSIEPLGELAARIVTHGARAAIQIAPLAGYNDPAWQPDPSELPAMIESIGAAAERAVRAGFEAVELLLSGGSVLSHLLSPVHNRGKVPGYGEGWEERLRAIEEALSALRLGIGDRAPYLVRIHGHEFLEGGYDGRAIPRIVELLERSGVAAINVTGGGHRTPLPQITFQVPTGGLVHVARPVRAASALPLLVGGRLGTPLAAEAALVATGAEFVNVARALIADPEWPAKAADGREDRILPCMTCGVCFDRAVAGHPVRCSLNPESCLPTEMRRARDAGSPPRRVLVAGAGPAGLEAAWLLRRQGHEVQVLERASRPGGRWRLASGLHGQQHLRPSLAAFVERLRREGVSIETGVTVTPELVHTRAPDVLVLAIGARPRRPAIDGLDDHPHVLDVDQVLAAGDGVGQRVAIIGAGGAGLELAIHLAGVGEPSLESLGFLARYGERAWLDDALDQPPRRQVTLLRRRGYVGRGLGRSVRWTMLKDLERLRIRVLDRCDYQRVTATGVEIHNRRTKQDELVEADTLIVASGFDPDPAVAEQFAGAAPRIITIGDALEVANIGAATASACDAVLALELD
jgi:2,4-dienoyl-CoA reductase (NADPH2)